MTRIHQLCSSEAITRHKVDQTPTTPPLSN